MEAMHNCNLILLVKQEGIAKRMGRGKKRQLEDKPDSGGVKQEERSAETPNGLVLYGICGACKGKVYKKQEEKGLTALGVGRKRGQGAWINDETVSSRHSEIVWRQAVKEWWIFDQNSTNGTWLNGQPVTQEGR